MRAWDEKGHLHVVFPFCFPLFSQKIMPFMILICFATTAFSPILGIVGFGCESNASLAF